MVARSEPFFEGGSFHKGDRARVWDVENGALIGLLSTGRRDQIDLSEVKSLPRDLHIEAYALGRDVDIIVPIWRRVELAGRAAQ